MLHSVKNVKSGEELERESGGSTAGRSSTGPAIAAKCEKKQAAKPRMQSRRRRKAGKGRLGLGRVGVHGEGDSAGFGGWQEILKEQGTLGAPQTVIPDLIRDPATARPRGERLLRHEYKGIFRLADARLPDAGASPA
jgi:hypothetical protein